MGKENFNSFKCLAGVNSLLFSQLCLYYYAEISKEHDYGVQSIYHQTDKDNISPKNQLTWLKKIPTIFYQGRWIIGQVTIGTKQQPICIPSNSTITIPGHTSRLPPRVICLVEQVEHHNLLLGIVINQCMATQRLGPYL